MSRGTATVTEVFKALSDPIRWSIVQQVAQEEEFACSVLEDTLPVSKPTISYHTKILTQAGLIEVHKRGRNYYYSLRRDVLHEVIGDLWTLAPGPRPMDERADDRGDVRTGRTRHAAASGDTGSVLITW
jgi:DNA-binding transcriptional ArsR family regulator